ncbi:MAG: HAD family hydrolase [Thermanaerothrix sp.]|nr:HAD family hydrolase [Thermanaerothrix sp.]
MNRAVFLDRDGVIIRDVGYLGEPAGVELLPGVPKALGRLKEAGWMLVVVTNQSGIGRGFFSEEDHLMVRRRMEELLYDFGVRLDGYFHCPHGPMEGCFCRKPRPGLVLKASWELQIDPARSFVVGDKMSDVELAWNVGALGILVGDDAPSAVYHARGPILRTPGLAGAAELILGP